MSRSGRTLLSVLILAGSTFAGTAGADPYPVPEVPPPDPVPISSTVDSGPVPLTVDFAAAAGKTGIWEWDFTADGIPDATGPEASWTFTTPGQHLARVTVTDEFGMVSAGELPIVAGNTRPAVVIESPVDGAVAEPGEPVPFRVGVTDTEDGTADCTKVVVTYDSRSAKAGPDCTGVLPPDAEVENRTFTATYTDSGAPDVPPLTGSAQVVLNPREHQVPLYSARFAPEGWFTIPHINLAGVHHLSMELATVRGGNLTVHADSPAGPVVASFANVPATGSQFQWLAADVVDPGGVHDLYFVADSPELSARVLRFQTVPAVTATVPPANGWQTTDVPVSVTAAPLWDPQVSLDGGATWLDTPVVLSEDGAYDVRYRAVDAAGRTSEAGATAVRIDRTAPAIVAPGREHARGTTLPVAATDATSGVATVAATVDGRPVSLPVELWHFPPGIHQLAVTATDAAGNSVTQTTELDLTASVTELLPLLEQFDVPFLKGLFMRMQLMAAEGGAAAGDTGEAVRWVHAFRYSASLLPDPTARRALTSYADAVVEYLLRV